MSETERKRQGKREIVIERKTNAREREKYTDRFVESKPPATCGVK